MRNVQFLGQMVLEHKAVIRRQLEKVLPLRKETWNIITPAREGASPLRQKHGPQKHGPTPA